MSPRRRALDPPRSAPRRGTLGALELAASAIAVALLVIAFAWTAQLSLHWRVMHDAPIMLYLGYLVDHFHAVPYRDLFDMNAPGTYVAFAAIGRLTGYSDLALRCVDLGLVALLMLALARALRPFGWRSAALGPLFYATCYLGLAEFHALQRESLALLPVAAAVALLSPAGRAPLALRAWASGLALGLAATIKPGLLLDAPVFLVFLLAEARHEPAPAGPRGLAGLAGRWLAALAAAPVACALWLAATGAAAPFMEIVRRYWPLYARLGGLHETLADHERPAYLLRGLAALGGYRAWAAAALLGLGLAFRRTAAGTRERRFVLLGGGLLAAHALYPATSGQFWPYHWFPFVWSLAFASALCLAPAPAGAPRARTLANLACVAVLAFTLRMPAPLARALAGVPAPDPYGQRVREIAGFLDAHLEPGDTVQPLDWTGGAVDAMLRSRARLATPFVYDFHFYHHVSSPYIQTLRARFLAALESRRPRFVIRVWSRKPWPQGEDTSREFGELDTFLGLHYQLALAGDGYQILVRTR